MIKIDQKGSFDNLENLLSRNVSQSLSSKLTVLGQEGVNALAAATPKDSGYTASAWYYLIEADGSGITLTWRNHHVEDGYSIALLIQYGHGTRNGGYVRGVDYINPALSSLFKRFADEAWKEVTR